MPARVAINGYGTIGKRVADAVRLQSDMEIVGVTTYYGYYKKENTEKRDMARDAEFGKMADFIKEYDSIWSVAYPLGKRPCLFISNISRRRADKLRH